MISTAEQSYQVPIDELRGLVLDCYPGYRIDRVVYDFENLTEIQVIDFYASGLERIGRISLTRIPHENVTHIRCEPSGQPTIVDTKRSLQRVPWGHTNTVFTDPDHYLDDPSSTDVDPTTGYMPSLPSADSELSRKMVQDRLEYIQRERPLFWQNFLTGLWECLERNSVLQSTVFRRGGRPKGKLDERNREIYRKYCEDGMTLQEIANVTEGIGYERVKQIVRTQRLESGDCDEKKKKGR